LRFYSEFVRPGDLVFDVGANVGTKTALFVALGAKVVAFEPQPECARILAKRFSEPSSVRVVPKGLAAETGTLTLNICSEAPVLSSFSPDWTTGPFAGYESDEQVEVEVITLDAALQQFGTPQFIKVDVEGYERSVLRGLSKPVRAISYEFHSALIDEALGCAKMLKRLGLQEFNVALGEESALCAPDWLDYSSLECALRALASDSAGTWGDVYARSDDTPRCTV
jgi:FkbM family methyltransferase